jgi:signal transduction histidine kinase/CheY-like chemotaxis protein
MSFTSRNQYELYPDSDSIKKGKIPFVITENFNKNEHIELKNEVVNSTFYAYSFFSLLIFVFAASIFQPAYSQHETNKESIYQKGKIIVGDDIYFPPYSFLDENNEPAGFNIDIVTAAARAMGLEVEIRLDSWAKTRAALENGEIDALSGLFYSDERNKTYGFTSRHSVGTGDIFTRKNTTLSNIEELAGKQVVVQKADIIAEYLAALDIGIILIEVSTAREVLTLIENGDYEYAGLAKIPGLYGIRQNNYENIKPQGLPFLPKDYCIAVKKENEDLLHILNAGMLVLKTTDEYQAIYDKWLGVYEDESPARFLLKYRWIIYFIILIFLLLAVTSLVLKHLVNEKTNELTKINRELTESNKEIQEKNKMLADSQKELKSRLDEIERQGEIIRFKQNFLANMSHEIRTPLTGILGMVDILGQSHLTCDQKEYVNILKHSGENLREIINQVLDYSKIEAGKVLLNKNTFNCNELIVQAKKLFQSLSGGNISFETHIDSHIPTFISADKNRITQIINNLISNSIKFTPKGKISLKAEKINIPLTEKDICIKISIVDTGLGIKPEKQKTLFRPFAQIHESDQREFDGTGLGLSICKELAILHGGEIGVESKYGEGSTFWFTFLAQIADDPKKNELPINSMPGKAQKNLMILMAEDKIVNQKVMKLLLTSFGHQVEIVDNGDEAVKRFEPGKFDLILMDIQMPVMDGITATRFLRAKYDTLPPIVGLSANAFEGDREKYISLGLDEYLTKPLKKDDFLEVLNRIIKN